MNRWRKPLFILLGVLTGFILIALVLPFVVDLNHFKPQIQDLVADRVRGQVDFSSLRLDILHGPSVRIQDMTLENTDPQYAGTRTLAVGSALFRADFLPLLKGHLAGTLVMNEPVFHVVGTASENNLLSLVKEKTKEELEKAKAKARTKNQTELLRRMELKRVVIRHGTVTARGFSEKEKSEKVFLQDLNMSSENLGLDRRGTTQLSAFVDSHYGRLQAKGPIRFFLTATPRQEKAGFTSLAFRGEGDFKKLRLVYGNVLNKDAKIPMSLAFDGAVSSSELIVRRFRFVLQNLAVNANARVFDFSTLASDSEIFVKERDLRSLAPVFPAYAALLNKASLFLQVNTRGSLRNLSTVKVLADMRANILDSDLNLQTNLVSLQPVRGSLNVQSKRLNLDPILDPLLKMARHEAAQEIEPGADTKGEEAKEEQNEGKKKGPLLTDAQKKKLEGLQLNVDLKIDQLVYHKADLKDIRVKVKQEELATKLEKLKL